jgi:hypothetical protein
MLQWQEKHQRQSPLGEDCSSAVFQPDSHLLLVIGGVQVDDDSPGLVPGCLADRLVSQEDPVDGIISINFMHETPCNHHRICVMIHAEELHEVLDAADKDTCLTVVSSA